MLWFLTFNFECFLETTLSPFDILQIHTRDRFFKVCLIHLDHRLLLRRFSLLLVINIDKIKRSINSNVKRMMNANMKKMMRMITEQFS